MTETHPQHSKCLPCRRGRHLGCLWATRPTSCGCLCPWLTADVVGRFPSLRQHLIEPQGDQ